jgi:hypothetical protein
MDAINTQVVAMLLVVAGLAVGIWQMYKNTQ